MTESLQTLHYPSDWQTMPNMTVFGAYEEETNGNKKQFKTLIGLYTSETVVYDEQQSYETPFMLDFVAKLVGGVTGLRYLAKAPGFVGSAAKATQGFAQDSIKSALENLGVSGVQSSGITQGLLEGKIAINPLVAVIYSHPNLRTFQYNFTFAPRNAKEAAEVERIINRFRYHAAPGVYEGTNNLLFKIPEKWTIEHMSNEGNGGFKVNKRIPLIKSCILEAVNIDYAPNGQFVTYSDDFPVQTNLRLAFKEIELITKKDIDSQNGEFKLSNDLGNVNKDFSAGPAREE